MFRRTIQRTKQASLVLPKEMVDPLDDLSSQTELNRSEVVAKLLTHDLEKQEVLDEVFGPMEESDKELDEDDNGEEEDDE